MGALRKVMPITSATFIIGWLAIAGVPPFAGFWSKDEILVNAWDKSPVLWFVGVFAAVLTAFYMTRQVYHGLLRQGPLGRGPPDASDSPRAPRPRRSPSAPP